MTTSLFDEELQISEMIIPHDYAMDQMIAWGTYSMKRQC